MKMFTSIFFVRFQFGVDVCWSIEIQWCIDYGGIALVSWNRIIKRQKNKEFLNQNQSYRLSHAMNRFSTRLCIRVNRFKAWYVILFLDQRKKSHNNNNFLIKHIIKVLTPRQTKQAAICDDSSSILNYCHSVVWVVGRKKNFLERERNFYHQLFGWYTIHRVIQFDLSSIENVIWSIKVSTDWLSKWQRKRWQTDIERKMFDFSECHTKQSVKLSRETFIFHTNDMNMWLFRLQSRFGLYVHTHTIR